MLAARCSLEEKIVEMVLLAYHSHLSYFGDSNINSCTRESTKPSRVLFGRSLCPDKRNTTLGDCWRNLLVSKEKEN